MFTLEWKGLNTYDSLKIELYTEREERQTTDRHRETKERQRKTETKRDRDRQRETETGRWGARQNYERGKNGKERYLKKKGIK